MSERIHGRWAAAMVLVLGSITLPSLAQAQGETFGATASIKNPAGTQVTAPVTIVVTRPTSDTERTAIIDAMKRGGRAPAIAAMLKNMPDAGHIEVGGRRNVVKYAYVRPISGGRLITVIAPTPIVHLGSNLPDAQPKTGYDLALATFEVKDTGAGAGELALAATVKLNASGAVEVDDYGTEVVRLTNVVKK